jgi:hypothetical protein
MPRRGKIGGFAELGPEQTANDLFGHLKTGDKVAIVSRFSKEHAQSHIDALERRGLQVRYVTGQTGVQDFCFLMSTQKEMIGPLISTYFAWASFLSNSTRIVAYSLGSKQLQPTFRPYNVTNLKSRLVFRLFEMNETTKTPSAAPAPSSEQLQQSTSSTKATMNEPHWSPTSLG